MHSSPPAPRCVNLAPPAAKSSAGVWFLLKSQLLPLPRLFSVLVSVPRANLASSPPLPASCPLPSRPFTPRILPAPCPHLARTLPLARCEVCVCPLTEASLGDGVFKSLEATRGRVSLGNDCNARIDMFEEMRWLECVFTNDCRHAPPLPPPPAALRRKQRRSA